MSRACSGRPTRRRRRPSGKSFLPARSAGRCPEGAEGSWAAVMMLMTPPALTGHLPTYDVTYDVGRKIRSVRNDSHHQGEGARSLRRGYLRLGGVLDEGGRAHWPLPGERQPV